MTDAQSAIIDIQSALVEYGSAITFNKVTVGAYSPTTGTAETIVATNMKALIKKYASNEMMSVISDNINLSNYNLYAMFYYSGVVTVADTIVFRGEKHKIIYVAPSYLQDTVIKYEVLLQL